MTYLETKQCRSCKKMLPCSLFPKRLSNKDGLYSYCRPCDQAKQKIYRNTRVGWKEHKKDYDRKRCDLKRIEISERGRLRYAEHRSTIIQNVKTWIQQNPERRKLIAQNYKHRRRAIERAGMSTSEFSRWKADQDKVCRWCGIDCSSGFVVDHVFPLAKGGKHEATNLAISCRSCNARKAARDPAEFARFIGASYNMEAV